MTLSAMTCYVDFLHSIADVDDFDAHQYVAQSNWVRDPDLRSQVMQVCDNARAWEDHDCMPYDGSDDEIAQYIATRAILHDAWALQFGI
jgi:hypothetical protein